MTSIPIAWLQLKKDKFRLLVAIGGVAFAVTLVFMQLGFRDALFTSAIRMHTLFRYDLAMISPKTPSLVFPATFSRRRIAQVRGFDSVASAEGVHLGFAKWKNPENPSDRRAIYMIGFDPAVGVIDVPEIDERRGDLTRADVAFFDERSRKEFGPIPDLVRRDGTVDVELEERRLRIIGLFPLGTSFGIDASLVLSDLNFLRYNTELDPGDIGLGLITLQEGADPKRVREEMQSYLPKDTTILTRDEFIKLEVDYWDKATPVGYIFSLGSIVGLIVGAIIVYQILFADVTDHMREYATLKAMGFGNASLSGIVLRQSLILAVLGFIPGTLITLFLYRGAGAATKLPMEMTTTRAVLVFGLTVLICTVSATIAQRKVRGADPADVF